MRNRIIFLLLSVLLVAGGVLLSGCGDSGDRGAAQGGQKYHCPMHPTYVADRPGDCPICGMKLVRIKEGKPAAKPADEPADERIAQVQPGQFYCPMGAEHVQDGPGECPKCGMDLVQKKAPGEGGQEPSEGAASPSVPGRISIHLSPEKRQMIGLTLAKVEKRELTRTVRTTAVVVHDETRFARIAPRFGGWVRKLHVAFTGAPVEKGEPVFTVYSPELFSAENEYLIAWRGLEEMKGEASEEQRRTGTNLLRSARRRLELWEISDKEIRELEKRGTASDEMLFRAPITGHVVGKAAVEGKAFTAGESLYEVADLSRLWVDVWLYESDLPLMQEGLEVKVTFPYLGHQTFSAPIEFVYPHIDPQTRRGRVRLALDNPEHLLRPDMWANAEIEVPLGEKLVVPASAVINTGERFVAFVEGEDEHLQPREVKVGAKTDDFYEVLGGVNEGEKVVVRALFLVDSESQLKAAIAGMGEAGAHQH